MTPSRSSASNASSTQTDAPPCGDSLARTSAETCWQHERLSRLIALGVESAELAAAHAMVDTIDLALEETVRDFERRCSRAPDADAELRQTANALWLAARDYLRRHSIAEKASRQLRQGTESLNDLHFEYELEASALLALRQATEKYMKLRPESRLQRPSVSQ